MPDQAPDPLSVIRVVVDDTVKRAARVDCQMVPFVVASALSARGAPGGGLAGFLLDVFEF